MPPVLRYLCILCCSIIALETIVLTLPSAHSRTPHTQKHPAHTVSSTSLKRSKASRQALQITLQKEIQQLKEREHKTALATHQTRLSTRQVMLLKRQQHQLNLTLIRTKRRLTQLNAKIAQLDTRDHKLQQQQEKQLHEGLALLPALTTLGEAPEQVFFSSPLKQKEASPSNDPALALPLLRARLMMAQEQSTDTQEKRDTLRHRQTLLNQRAQNAKTQRQLQEKRRISSRKQAQQALLARQKAEKNLAHSRALLRQSQQKMQSLTNAITRLSRQEKKTQQRLQQQARHLKRTHQKTKAHQTEKAIRALQTGSGLATGRGLPPVQGALITRWKQPTEAGPSTGLTYRASSSATVVAPCSGRLLYTGDFRSFGPMVILDCGRSQRFIIAGLGHISVSAQHSIKQRASLGTMPPHGGNLFVQLRHGTRIINPTPFLTSAP